MKNLNEKAMLVKLNISTWEARKYDKKISDEVADLKGAHGKDVGRYNKILIARDSIRKVSQVGDRARAFHREQSLPWTDSGTRILPSKNYERYMKGMREIRAEFEAQVKEFCDAYPALVEEAKKRLKGMFNVKDYPNPNEIAWRYSYNVAIDPIPVGKDFRVGLAGGEIDRIAKEIEERLKTATAEAMKDLWRRLYEVIEHMAERLGDKDAVFRDSLVSNVVELVDLLPSLNLTDDSELENMRRKIEATLCSYAPQVLRDDERERSKAAKNAEAILKQMSAYVGGEKK